MKIPMEVFASMKNDKKNVLIISMSTLPKDSKTNYYYVKHNGEDIFAFYQGKYSMEPGTKHVLNKLGQEGRKLDKIIMLATPETRVDAVAYYKNEIKRFIKEGDVLDNCREIAGQSENDKLILRNFVTKIEGVSYSEKEIDDLFKEIPLSDMKNLSYDAIPQIVEEVLKVSEPGVNLFLDMQGGSRVSTFIINAAVNMLQDDTIKLERSYATLYNRNHIVHQLRDESLSNHVFDMVSGMDEFLNYGRAKKFKEYFAYYKENHKKEEELEENDIVEAIDKISEAISICNIDGFYDGLDNLKSKIDSYRLLDDDKKDAIFRAFVEKMERTYGGILSGDRRAVDVMKWCLDKEWYQQALTVCESKMPQQMVEEKVVYYCKSQSEKPKEIEKLQGYYEKCGEHVKYVKDTAIFVLKNIRYCKKDKDERKVLKFIEKGELYSDYCTGTNKEKLKKIINQYEKLANMRNKVNHGSAENISLVSLKKNLNEFIEDYRDLVQDNWKTNRLTADCMITMGEIDPDRQS